MVSIKNPNTRSFKDGLSLKIKKLDVNLYFIATKYAYVKDKDN